RVERGATVTPAKEMTFPRPTGLLATNYVMDLAPLPLNSTHTHTAASIAILSEFVVSFKVFVKAIN
ncbi:MAG: hypothetical protein RJAPGHWK_001808, partial [Candidatus Fervidibacter sp.]